MSDDLNPETRRLVDLARRGRSPGAADKLRIAERLAVPLAAGAAAGSAAATAKATGGAVATAKAAGLGISAKLAVVVALGAVVTAAIVGQTDSKPAPVAAPIQPQQKPEPALTKPAPEPAPVAPEALAPLAEQPAPPKSASQSAVHSAKPADALAEEAALLHQAQAAWRAGQSAQALSLASQHAQRFPRSQLANERDVLRVLSLCKLGQTQAAKQVGARLLKKAKGSPWYQSVAESCAGE